MTVIENSELVRYNANNRGTNTGDCTARAISLAFNIPYSKARKALNQGAKDNWKKNWHYNTHYNVINVIRDLGGGEIHEIFKNSDTPISVNDWADTHSTGTYIIWCSKNGKDKRNLHLVAIINGTVYDSWDSRSYYVLGYWEINSGINSDQITDISSALDAFFRSRDVHAYVEYTNVAFDKIIDKNKKLKKLADEYNADIDISIRVEKISWVDYNFRLWYIISVAIPTLQIPNTSYELKMGITFKPTMTEDEIEPFFDATFDHKLYFSVYNIINKIEDMCESYELLTGGDPDTVINDVPDLWLGNKSEQKSFNSLPYWAKSLATRFKADAAAYGDYSDRVELTIKIPKFDLEYDPEKTNETRYFHSYNVNDLKAGLDYYKRTGDYEHAYEIAGDY